MKKTLLTLASLTALLNAGGDIAPIDNGPVCGLYSYTYMPNSGVEHPCIDTGIANPFDGSMLLHKKIVFHASLYFENGTLSDASQKALEALKQKIAEQGGADYYVGIVGHTSGYEDDAHAVPLNGWSSFWQNLTERTMTREEAASEVNARIKEVYDAVTGKTGVGRTRIYTENRLARDPIATEATAEGSARNERVDVVLFK